MLVARSGSLVIALALGIGPYVPSSALTAGAPAGSPSASPALAPALAPTPTPFRDALGRETPRGAVAGFMRAANRGRWDDASRYLDLRKLPPEEAADGPRLARQLKDVLDGMLWVNTDRLDDQPEGDAADGLPPELERVGEIASAHGPVAVLLERVEGPRGAPVWLVSAGTLGLIAPLYAELGHGRLSEAIPEALHGYRVFHLELWQWVATLLLAVAAWIASGPLVRPVVALGRRFVAASPTVDDHVVDALRGPLRLVTSICLFVACMPMLGLPLPARRGVVWGAKGIVLAALVWLLLRVLDVAARTAELRLTARGDGYATTAVRLGRRTVQLLVALVGLIVLLQNLGVNVTGLLAGLGIGGIAIALAAQKSVENFIGGVALVLDRPVRVGDICRFGDKQGTVEDIGLRSTRVRLDTRQVVTVPNAEFSNLQLENLSHRDRFRFLQVVSLRAGTAPAEVRRVLAELDRLLASHPRIAPAPAARHVHLVRLGTSSLDLEVLAYVQTTDGEENLAIAEELLLRILDVIEASETALALPAQTLYVRRDADVDDTRRKDAQARIAAWRDSPASE